MTNYYILFFIFELIAWVARWSHCSLLALTFWANFLGVITLHFTLIHSWASLVISERARAHALNDFSFNGPILCWIGGVAIHKTGREVWKDQDVSASVGIHLGKFLHKIFTKRSQIPRSETLPGPLSGWNYWRKIFTSLLSGTRSQSRPQSRRDFLRDTVNEHIQETGREYTTTRQKQRENRG